MYAPGCGLNGDMGEDVEEGRLWTGVTSLWPEGVEPAPEVLLEAFYLARTRSEIIGALEGEEINREQVPPVNLTILGLETNALVNAQRACPELGLYYVAVNAKEGGHPISGALAQAKREIPELWVNGPKPASIERQSEKFTLSDGGVLCRKVYDTTDGEMQLRVCVPSGPLGRMEVPGVGSRDLTLRNRLLLEYHNSKLGGHLGRDKTYMRLERDWWWPGMYADVMSWCKHCLPCQQEQSRTSQSAWSRTEFYDRPFRVLQFDLVTCADHGGNEGDLTSAKYILSCICCFCRWPWLIPVVNKSGCFPRTS